MCDIESVNKIAKYLKVNPGKIAYNSDKVQHIDLKRKFLQLNYYNLFVITLYRS